MFEEFVKAVGADTKKIYVQHVSDYDGGEVTGVLIGPANADFSQLQKEWRETWDAKPFTRKGVTKPGKTKYPTIGWMDWLIRDKGFVPLEINTQWSVMWDY
jgi:hypothetical protein